MINRTLVFGDSHLETLTEVDKSYLLFKKVVQILKPSTVIINGDLLDFSYISKFSENVLGATEGKRLKDDFDILRKELAFFKKYSKRVIYLEGNHENRLNKYLEKNPVLKGLFKISDVVNEIEVEFIPINQQPYNYRDDLLLAHGLSFTKYFSCKHVEQCNNNIICAHTHRTQTYTTSFPDGSVLTGYGIGTLGPLNPEYIAGQRLPGWSHSFAEILEDEESRSIQINMILINDKDNSCIINGKKITH